MPRRKKSVAPTFVPWADSSTITLRHHDHDMKVGRITLVTRDGVSEWRLAWELDYLPATCHDDAQAATLAARRLLRLPAGRVRREPRTA